MGQLASPVRCGRCQSEVPTGFRFCGRCGAAVAAAPVGGRPSGAHAERRQLTVVFCDLAESTRLAEVLDLEDLRDVVRAYQAAAVAVIERYGGHVAQYLGDGILAYFGYPEAREDDARRAVHAALGVIRSIESLSGQLDPELEVRLGARVAAHTGFVVTGDVGAGEHHESLALGPTPNIAARLQEVAAVGTVAISDATLRLVEGFFECSSLGARSLKGRAEPMEVHRVVRETGAATTFDVAVARGLSRAVGRRAELAMLDAALADAAQGKGRLVVLQGEAGIGKSRLLQLFSDRVGESAALVTCRCATDDALSPLRPVVLLIEQLFGFARDATAAAKLRALETATEGNAALPADALPLLASLLEIPTGDAHAPLHLGPGLQRSRTQEVLLSLLLSAPRRRPVVLVVEDLHWADPSTIELLALAVRRVGTARVLLLGTARPEFSVPWADEAGVTVQQVGRLGPADVEVLATSVAGGMELPPEVLRQLVARTDGVPLFVEEMTKLVIESGILVARDGRFALRGPLDVLAIPATLHESLLARLDRLGPAKGIAQRASVIGREFTLPMLRCVSRLDETTLASHLERLVGAGLLDPAGAPAEERYLFSHALIKDAAYESLLKSTRRRYHRAMAETVAERFPEIRRTQPELFGAHFAAAGNTAQAIACWIEASDRAGRAGAAVESVTYCRNALELLPRLGSGAERDRAELALQMRLADGLSVLQSYASPEAASAYQRAQQLAGNVREESTERFDAVFGLYRYHYLRGDLAAALGAATELLDRANHRGPVERVIARYSLGFVQWSRAGFVEVLPQLEEGLAQDLALWGAPEEGRVPAGTGTIAQGVQVRCTARVVPAMVLSHLGELDRALELVTEAVHMAQAARQPYSEAFSLYSRALVHLFRRDPAGALADAKRVVEISRTHGYFFAALGSVILGWAMAHAAGAPAAQWSDETLAMMQRGLAGYRGAGARATQTISLTLIAEAHRARGEGAEASGILDDALAAVEATGERQWLPEIHRQRALLARDAGDEATAGAEWQQALEIAKAQSNRLLEAWVAGEPVQAGGSTR